MQKQMRFSALDGLRGFAAIGVFLYHGADLVGFRVASGYLAVDFFFSLSGFVIAAAYEQRLLAGEGMPHFMIARLTRLYPVYLLGMVSGLLFALFRLWRDGTSVEPLGFAGSFVLCLLFLPSPPELTQSFSARAFPFVVQAWSLFYELVANGLYAASVRQLTNARVVVLLLLILPFLIGAAFSFGSLDLGPEWETMAAGFARAFFSFLAGVLIFRLRPSAVALPGWSGWACAVVLLVVLSIEVSGPILRPIYDLAAALLVFPALTLAASVVSEGAANRTIFSLLGAASYPLYILHGTILNWVRAALKGLHGSPEALPQLGWLLFFAAVICLCAMIDLFYERGAIRWLRSKFGQ